MALRFAGWMLAAVASAAAADVGLTYAEAQKAWEASKNKSEYQSYVQEFARFNNHFHLDERNGCHKLEGGRVELMLVVRHGVGQQYAHIEEVLSRTDTPKAQCFKKTYGGIRTKVPPFVPFVLQMSLG